MLKRKRIAFLDGFASSELVVESGRKHICIATEDILGPTRNGGIGSAYAELALFLASEGHDVTILYLRGRNVENGSIEDWIEYYAARNLRLFPLPDAATCLGADIAHNQVMHTSFNLCAHFMRYLYDLIHVSEWRGAAYMSLLCRHLHPILQKQMFVVKGSSPRLWTLECLGRKPTKEDFVTIEAEQRSIELADIVVSGSAHLLEWMAAHKYLLPEQRSYVQPNIILEGTDKRNNILGTYVKIDELTFFGRLEPRKGLAVFCDAVDELILSKQSLPPISFLGKEGMAMLAGQPALTWLRQRTSHWVPQPRFIVNFDRDAALDYLIENNCLAVMPSLMENSSIAVYEALRARIPFVASHVGGTPELVAEEDHSAVLFENKSAILSVRIRQILQRGAKVARFKFDCDKNLCDWRYFHSIDTKAFKARLKIEQRDRSLKLRPSKQWREVRSRLMGTLIAHESKLPSTYAMLPNPASLRVLYARRGKIHGYVRPDVLSPDTRIIALHNNEIVGHATLRQALDWPIVPEGLTLGFDLEVNLVSVSHAPAKVEIRVEGTNITETVFIYARNASIGQTQFEAVCTSFDENEIRGWAFNKENREYRVELDFFINDSFVGRTVATQYLSHLRKICGPPGNLAFSYHMPFALEIDDTVDVVLARSGLALMQRPYSKAAFHLP